MVRSICSKEVSNEIMGDLTPFRGICKNLQFI